MVEGVEAFGGTVKDLAGDGILALFGAPVTHEDDAERAIRAALRIVRQSQADASRSRSASASRPGWWCSVRSAGEAGSSTARPATR
jgi:class 3 adenylate cyclase